MANLPSKSNAFDVTMQALIKMFRKTNFEIGELHGMSAVGTQILKIRTMYS